MGSFKVSTFVPFYGESGQWTSGMIKKGKGKYLGDQRADMEPVGLY
jgi:hypothetical protein